MTDLEKFVELYKSFGIILEIKDYDNDGAKFVELNDSNEKLECNWMHSTIVFDKSGKFINQTLWDF